jgi:endonuclease/exonuclease/phosphatase family metal-dependent hydrolase
MSRVSPSCDVDGTALIPQRFKRTLPFPWSPTAWQPISADQPETPATNDPAELRIGTLNRWFESKHAKERNDALVEHLDKLDWDVFCLQETTQSFIRHVASHSLVQKSWIVSDSTGGSLPPGGYGLYTLYNPKTVDVISVSNHALPSTKQGRIYQVSILRMRSKAKHKAMTAPLRIINVHLESPTRHDIASSARADQLAYLHAVAKQPYKGTILPTILLGDLNLVGEEEDILTDTLFADTWTKLRPHDTGHTFPSPYHKYELPPKRIDRILMSDTDCLKPVEIDIVLQEPVHVDRFGDVPISDHVGVLARIAVHP